MKLTKIHALIVPILLVLTLVGHFTGETTHAVKGLSPYSSSLYHFQESAFLEQEAIRKALALKKEKSVKEKIVRLIAEYKTDLKPKTRKKISGHIMRESKKYGHDPLFLTALIVTESSFDNRAKSKRGALGLMQIRPNTGVALAAETKLEWKGHHTLFDPASNIALGAFYLNKLIRRFGDISLALEAYNYGPTKLTRYLKKGIQPKKYSQKVLNHYERIKSRPI